MAGFLQLAQTVRAANARIRSAQALEARWKALEPSEQEAARAEWDNVRAAMKAVRERLESGPRGFAREFSAAYKGKEAEPVGPPRPLGELLGELHVATNAMREKLNAVQ
jgi:hypothetical protein